MKLKSLLGLKKILTYFSSLIIGAALAAFIFIWIAAGEIYDYTDNFNLEEDAGQTDVVLCLAGGKGRIEVAVNLWLKIKTIREAKRLSAPILFLSGVGPNAGFETLVDQGVSKEVLKVIRKDEIVFENVSENTFENVQIFSAFSKQKQWKHVVLVTASYHMRRAFFILKKTIDHDTAVKIETVDSIHFDRNEWHGDSYAVRVTIIEYLKWLYYRYTY